MVWTCDKNESGKKGWKQQSNYESIDTEEEVTEDYEVVDWVTYRILRFSGHAIRMSVARKGENSTENMTEC